MRFTADHEHPRHSDGGVREHRLSAARVEFRFTSDFSDGMPPSESLHDAWRPSCIPARAGYQLLASRVEADCYFGS